jgi:hypothetical protein
MVTVKMRTPLLPPDVSHADLARLAGRELRSKPVVGPRDDRFAPLVGQVHGVLPVAQWQSLRQPGDGPAQRKHHESE